MKASIRLVSLVICLAGAVFSAYVQSCNPRQEPARLILNFEKPLNSARTALPPDIAISNIEIEAKGPQGSLCSATSTGGSTIELELLPGEWIIDAKAYNSSGIALAAGRLVVNLSPSQRVTGTLVLLPCSGSGSLFITWKYLGSIGGELRVDGRLLGPQETELPIAAAFSEAPLHFENLMGGGWRIELRLLVDGIAVCGLSEGIFVASGMETRLDAIFEPPAATLSLSLMAPNFSAPLLPIRPSLRRAAPGSLLSFEAETEGPLAWTLEGEPLAGGEKRISFDYSQGLGKRHLDCVAQAESIPRSGRASFIIEESRSLGSLSWASSLVRNDEETGSSSYIKALGDCRDLAWSEDGKYLALAGKSSNAISILEFGGPGSIFLAANLGGSGEPGLLTPNLIRNNRSGAFLALSEAGGKLYSIDKASGLWRLGSVYSDSRLVGAKDLLFVNTLTAYIAAEASDTIFILAFDEEGQPSGLSEVITAGQSGLEAFSRPSCLAASQDGSLVAVGCSGDDAIYIFGRDASTAALCLLQRLDKAAFATTAPLSDPCSLAFSPDASSLFVLSYYGKSVIRLNRSSLDMSYGVGTGLRSGTGVVSGFATPKRLALSASTSSLAVIGGGSDDGLTLFTTALETGLDYIASLLPTQDDAIPPKPTCAAFSPQGEYFVLAADGILSFFNSKLD